MYAQYRCLKADACLVLPPGTTPAEGGLVLPSNPLTRARLGRDDAGARATKALVHTAAASNLGQDAQPHLPRRRHRPGQHRCAGRKQGATVAPRRARHRSACRVRPASPKKLTDASPPPARRFAFDAIGGGRLASQILGAMEAALNRSAKDYAATARPRTSRSTSTAPGQPGRPRSFAPSAWPGAWRVAAVPGSCSASARRRHRPCASRRGAAQDHLRQRLRERRFRLAAACNPDMIKGIWPARDRHEVPDCPQPLSRAARSDCDPRGPVRTTALSGRRKNSTQPAGIAAHRRRTASRASSPCRPWVGTTVSRLRKKVVSNTGMRRPAPRPAPAPWARRACS